MSGYVNVDSTAYALPLVSWGQVHSLDVYFGVIYLSPGAVLPDHTHSDEEELERNIDGSDVSGWEPRTAVLRLDGVQGGVAS